jgi:hypothetical protein
MRPASNSRLPKVTRFAFTTDPALARALSESPLAGAVDMVNQERYLQENSGPCRGCAHPVSPDHNLVEPPGEVHVEPWPPF